MQNHNFVCACVATGPEAGAEGGEQEGETGPHGAGGPAVEEQGGQAGELEDGGHEGELGGEQELDDGAAMLGGWGVLWGDAGKGANTGQSVRCIIPPSHTPCPIL